MRLPNKEVSDANIPQNNCHISPKKSKIENFIPKVEKTSIKNEDIKDILPGPKISKQKNIQESQRKPPVKSSNYEHK